jgi:hypothetical protein
MISSGLAPVCSCRHPARGQPQARSIPRRMPGAAVSTVHGTEPGAAAAILARRKI